MNKQLNEMSLLMTGSGSSIYMVESFMEEHYAFRRNLLSGKTEMAVLKDIDEASSVDEKEETTLQNSNLKWEVMTKVKGEGKTSYQISKFRCPCFPRAK